jgi:hypothetical protein
LNNSIDSLDESFDGITCAFEELQKVFSNLLTNNLEEYIEAISSLVENISGSIKEMLKASNNAISEIIKSYCNSEISIPNLDISSNNYDYVPQAPPKEKSIKETAIENFKSNMKSYLNSKFIRFIKKKLPIFFESLIFGLLQYLIFNALGMH